MKPIAYLVNTKEGLEGTPGLFYDYILAGNGLFIRGASPLLKATVLISLARVRGLAPLDEKIELARGKIPRGTYGLALSILLADRYRERYLAVTWEGEYHLRTPPQEGTEGGVSYERLPGTVLDIHSHGRMRAWFSPTDNADELGLRLYMVVGRLDRLLPEIEIRVGVYGYFAPVHMNEVFDVQTGQ